jgi:hypothetical protein
MALADLIAAIQARAEAASDLIKHRLGDPLENSGLVGKLLPRGADWSQSDWLTTVLGGLYDWLAAGGAPLGPHAATHRHGGADEVATATAGANEIPKADASGKLDSWISDAAAGTKGLVQLANALGGTAASPKVVGVTETDGPTDLIFGDILDGEFLKRDGMTIVGAAAGGGGAESKEGLDITATVNAGDSLEINLTSMFSRGLISRVRISANSATLLTMVRFYGKDTFLAADLQSEAGDFDAYTTAWEDRNCWHYQDDDSSDEVHVKIYNHGTVNSTYIIYVVGIGE